MSTERSNACVLMAHCILAQTVRAEGCHKAPAAIKEIVQFCLDNDVNMIQMPCPETLSPCGGLPRDPHGKKWYEAAGLRDTCKLIARGQANYAKILTDAGKNIVAIIGVEFSPACSTVQGSNSPYRQYGIYMEEFENELSARGINPITISLNPAWSKRTGQDLKKLKMELEKS